jgi:aspartate oxidase
LTRENDALRYAFLGPSNAARLEAGVDLEQVLERVKELIRENEELGEMILESGREGHDEWQRALEGGHRSRAVLTARIQSGHPVVRVSTQREAI